MRLLWFTSESAVEQTGQTVASVAGFAVDVVTSVPDGLDSLHQSSYDAVLASFPMREWSPAELLEEVLRVNALMPVVIWDSGGSISDAIRLTRMGAFHFIGGDAPAPGDLARLIETGVEYRRSRELALFGGSLGEPWKRFLVGESRAMARIGQLIRLVGPRRCTILITGETGTGKEMVARAIHMASNRSHLPLVAVNCHALPENLLEVELFGHVKGAFTGAYQGRVGRFEQANRSTLFLDEIGDMPLETQAKLLRVLQEREFQRIGSSDTVRVDVRVIAATNADLVERVRQGRFREDLFYRLNVVPLTVAPLRERSEDIPLLVHHFVDKVCRQEDISPRRVAPETIERLASHGWPGNVRQLENAVEMAVALSGDREVLYPGDFAIPPALEGKTAVRTQSAGVTLPDSGLDFEKTVERFERQILDQAMRRTGGNKKRAADILRLKRTTLSAKLRSLEAAAAGGSFSA